MVSRKSSGDFGNFFQLFKISFFFSITGVLRMRSQDLKRFLHVSWHVSNIFACAFNLKWGKKGDLVANHLTFEGVGGGNSWKILKNKIPAASQVKKKNPSMSRSEKKRSYMRRRRPIPTSRPPNLNRLHTSCALLFNGRVHWVHSRINILVVLSFFWYDNLLYHQ